MSESDPTQPKPAERLKIEDVVAPIFDAAMGRRLRTARMWRLWDQEELGERLGLNSHTVSDLESGKLLVPRSPFSVTKLEEVLGPTAAKYVVLDRYAATFDMGRIETKYWDVKLRKDRKPRPPGKHWTAKALAEGRPTRGGSFYGIPTEVWELARRLNDERKSKKSKPIKR